MARLDRLSDQGLNSLLNAFSPPAPTAVKAVGGDGSATLSWVAPVTLSQFPVTDYQVQLSADGTAWTTFYDAAGSAATTTVTGLVTGSSYFFRVRAINAAGFGPYATTATASLIGLPPSAPLSLTAIAGERQSQLSWQTPASTGGVAVSDYAIEYSIDSGVTWVAVARPSASTSLSFTVTGLAGQTPHQFRVRAINGIGPGAWSATATATPFSYDEYWDDVSLLLKMDGSGSSFVDSSPNNTAITSVGATQSSTQKRWGASSADLAASSAYLSVANGPSTSLTGAFTIEFFVFFKTAPAREWYLFHGANNSTEGRNMSFLVTSSNGQGLRYGRSWVNYLGTASPAQFQAGRWYHIAVVREADFRIRLFVDGVQINQQTPLDVWSGSSSLSGRLFVGYPARSPVTFIDEFRVTKRARYSSNFTPPAEPFPTSKRPLAPAAPSAVTATAGNAQLSVAWVAAATATGYVVEYQQDGGDWVSAGSASTTSRAITGLTNGETYTVRVAAVNVSGQSVWATSAPVTLLIPPGQVTGLVASAGHLQSCLSWNAPDGDVTDYIVQYNGGSGWLTFSHPVSTAEFITVTGLTNGVSYQFRVAATNAQSTGGYSATATATPSLSLPESPTSVAGVAGSGQVSLTWTPPANTSCRLLTSYLVSYSSNSGGSWTDLSPQPATSAATTVSGLTNGTTYTFRVAYQSSAGTGPWSAASDAVTPSGPPSPPASVTGTPGSGEVNVAWVSGSSGGSPVIDYLLQYSTDGSTWTQIEDGQNTDNSYVVTGLTNGTTYYFRVSTRTAFGDSVPTQSAAVTPRGVPGAPGTPSGTAASGQVALQWTAADANGAAITDYTVEYTISGGVPQTVATGSSSASYTVTGLTNGESYAFRVRATNLAGDGGWSEASAPILVQGVPDAPTSLSGVVGNASIWLSWAAPANNGGNAITSYTVEYTPSGGAAVTVTASSSPYTITGLTNGTSYSIRVAASNSVGRGAYTAAITRTPATTPGTPTSLTATGGGASGRLALAWTAPSTGGSAITGYTVEYTPSGGSPQTVNTGSAAALYNLEGLTNGTQYSVRVRANNAIGAGSYSTAATGTPLSVPGAPTGFAGTIGNTQVALSWTAPTNTGGAAITNYTVEYTPSGGSAVTVTASSSPYTLTGLTNGTSYSIRVAANNSVGRGAYTTAISRTPAALPGTPTGLTATGGGASGRLALAWTAPSNGGASITEYTIEFTPDSGSAQTVSTGSAAASYNLEGLTNGTQYSVRVRANNATGAGSYSTTATGTPFYVPSAPLSLSGVAGNAQVGLAWTQPESDGGSPVTDYSVAYSSDGGSTWTTFSDGESTQSSALVTPLTNGTDYYFRVAAVNASGQGPWTAAAGPYKPLAPLQVQYMLVAGGGGGGFNQGGGGGAGGFVYEQAQVVPRGQTLNIVVGAGGAGESANRFATGASGGFSGFGYLDAVSGGGGGGGERANGANGGSGGGCGSGAQYGGLGQAGEGNNGGDRQGEATGGGGAGEVGQNTTSPPGAAGRGGNGVGCSIAGTLATYSGGGGGGWQHPSAGGAGGGGGGGGNPQNGYSVYAANGAIASGGGGGGGGSNNGIGGNGASGVVVIRCATPAVATTGSPVVTTVDGDTLYTFGGTGSITF